MSSRLELVAEILDCTACELHSVGGGPVPFQVPDKAKLVVVGEAPGRQEDAEGIPFIGPAGKLLRHELTTAGFDLDEIAFMNTVSCFPNGTPQLSHVQKCHGLKVKQLDFIEPQWALIVGKVALRAMMPSLDIRYGRGRPFLADGIHCFATYHPAAAMRNGKYLDALREDLERFKRIVSIGLESPDSCSGCSSDAEYWADNWLGWCREHIPDADRPAFAALHERVGRDYEEAKERLYG